MGDILGGIIGGVGSLFGGSSGASNALKGFNYLTNSKTGITPYVSSGNAANTAESALLTGGPNSAASNAAYNNYLNSTGYNFQLQQGSNAVTGSAAARGLLNSGSTAKALTQYGQNLASTTFSNYLNQLGGVAGQGLNAASMIGQAGTQGGTAAGNMQQAGISSGANQIGSALGSAWNNIFGGL